LSYPSIIKKADETIKKLSQRLKEAESGLKPLLK
jgi:hypothetical protein